jgi:hypothetical protein
MAFATDIPFTADKARGSNTSSEAYDRGRTDVRSKLRRLPDSDPAGQAESQKDASVWRRPG